MKMRSHQDGFRLSLQELELFYEMNYDLRRVLPIMILLALPFGNVLALPLV